MFLQHLALLAGDDLKALGHNSADYLHLLIESAKLAFADREAYYGDPRFDTVPLDVLLSPAYTAKRRALIGGEACPHFRPGDVGQGVPAYATFNVQEDNRRALQVAGRAVRDLGLGHSHVGDTTHLDAVDRQGNMVAATPSGGWLADSPVIRGLGFPLGSRGQMFYLNAARPNALAPRKRPRATLTPSLVTRGGKPFMVFGTPGGDGQEQWTLQFFLNHVVFGMNLQEALDAPTITCVHFPSSFYPRPAYPNRVEVEGRLDRAVVHDLERRGHEVKLIDAWANGKVMGIRLRSGARGDRGRRLPAAEHRHTRWAGSPSPRHPVETGGGSMLDLHTFSIVARDPVGAFGVAVATARPSVGSLVPFVSPAGAIATQARVNTELGRRGLALLEQGVPVQTALRALLADDADREIRQIHGVDGTRVFCHTGARCVSWCGHHAGDGFTVAGNMLAGPQVIAAMVEAYGAARTEQRELSECLLAALEAGQSAGGDKRGKQSAALLVASPEPRMYHNLRVDEHATPVAELRRIYEVVAEHSRQIEREYGSEGLRLFGRVKY